MDSAQAYARAYDLLARVGLADCANAYPSNMSGGEQRRVVIARALINSPRLLLADEPTSDLDEDTEADIIDLLELLQQSDSFGLVLVTHNSELAKRAQRTYEMRQGILEATDLQVSVEAEPRPRRFGPAKASPSPSRGCRPRLALLFVWAPICGAVCRPSYWGEPLCSSASSWSTSGLRNIKKFRFASAGHGSRSWHTSRSPACRARSSRYPTLATGGTNWTTRRRE
jgi:energy-coupling factor transporter ATP-binding protein EcfA2